MKRKNKVVMIQLLLVSFLLNQNAMARIRGVPVQNSPSQQSSGSGGTRTTLKTEVVRNEVNNLQPVQTESCSADPGKEKIFPQALFRELTRNGEDVSVKVVGNRVRIQLPPFLSVCGKFVPSFSQDKETKNVSIAMMLQDKNGKYLTNKEFEDCLVKSKLMKDGQINHSAIESKNYDSGGYDVAFDFDEKKDIKKTVHVTFVLPKSFNDPAEYGPLYGIEEKVAGEACMLAEKVASEPLYINKGKEVLLSEIGDVCRNGTADQIKNMRDNSLGNMKALQEITEQIKEELTVAYLKKVKEGRVQEIFKELDKITTAIKESKDEMEEEEAKKKLATYAKLTQELDQIFITPSIERLEDLLAKRDSLEDPSEALSAVDEEIKKVNLDIKEFSNQMKPVVTENLNALAKKFALTDSAKKIRDIQLKSLLYAQVYKGSKIDSSRGHERLTFERAAKKQDAFMKAYSQDTTVWENEYLASQGNTAPIKEESKKRNKLYATMNSQWSRYEEKERKDFERYCSANFFGQMKDARRCQSFTSGVERRRNMQLRGRERYLQKIKRSEASLATMEAGYNSHLDERMRERESDGLLDDDFGLYGDYGLNDDYGGSSMYSMSTGLYPQQGGGYPYMGNFQNPYGMQQPQPQPYGQPFYGGQQQAFTPAQWPAF